MEQLIQSNPDITAVYAENDEMGVGAVNALKAAGKTPGKDVKIVSIDGTRNAVQLIADGSYNAVIESNPRTITGWASRASASASSRSSDSARSSRAC